jgi:hypothetical protein
MKKYPINENKLIRNIKKMYNNGYLLDDICYYTKLDIDTVLEIIRKFRYRKKKLYEIYEVQEDQNIRKKSRIDIRNKLTEKYFPTESDDTFYSHSYHLYWKKKLKERDKRRMNCTHELCHIRCAKCGKILGDASEIYKKKQHETTF